MRDSNLLSPLTPLSQPAHRLLHGAVVSSPVKSMDWVDRGMPFAFATGPAAGRFVGRLRAFAVGGLQVELLEELGSVSVLCMTSSTSSFENTSISLSVNDSRSDLNNDITEARASRSWACACVPYEPDMAPPTTQNV